MAAKLLIYFSISGLWDLYKIWVLFPWKVHNPNIVEITMTFTEKGSIITW